MIESEIDRLKFPNSPQYGATVGVAMMPLNTIISITKSIDPELTDKQRQTASKQVWRDLKQILNVPTKLLEKKP